MQSTGPAHSVPQIRRYQDWLASQRGLVFDSYDALWRWSVADLDAFWQSIWDYFELKSPTPHTTVLAESRMPGAVWFAGAQFNYAKQVFRHVDQAHAAGFAALLSLDEKSLEAGATRALSWPELRRQAASLALHLQRQGLRPGDRVAAYLPNSPETIVAFLAVVSLGGALLLWVAAYHLADALQAVCAFLLRCYRIAMAPLILYGVLLWGLGLYGGYQLAYVGLAGRPASQAASSFWVASTVAIGMVAVCLLGLLLHTVRRSEVQSTRPGAVTPVEPAA